LKLLYDILAWLVAVCLVTVYIL